MRRQVQGDAQRCIIFRMENVDLMGHINDQGDLLLQHSELDTLLRQTYRIMSQSNPKSRFHPM